MTTRPGRCTLTPSRIQSSVSLRAKSDSPVSYGRSSTATALPTLEPEFIALVTTIVEDVKERWIEIRRRPDWTPVTIIELLSPTNKSGQGHTDYLYKRVSLIARSIHLLALDFLIGGRRLPMRRPLRGIYHALVCADRRPISDVFSWSVR